MARYWWIPVLALLLFGCYPTPTPTPLPPQERGPTDAVLFEFEKWAKDKGVPYRRATAEVSQRDDPFVTLKITTEFRESPASPWIEQEAIAECRKVGKEWQCDKKFSFAVTPEGKAWANAAAQGILTELKQLGKIAFGSLHQWMVIDADGQSEPREFPRGHSHQWSPNGRYIAFVKDAEIYVVATGYNYEGQLTKNSFDDDSPTWSPDGQKIAFVSKRDGNEEIYVMGADGSNQRRLTNNSARDWSPVWSPDARKIAFVSNRDGNKEIYVIDADGGNRRRLTNNSASDWDPAWSSDGSKITFLSDRGGKTEIHMMDNDGSNQHQLTNIYSRSITWSPDRRRLAFVSDRDGNDEIYVMDADGGNQRRLTNNPTDDFGHVWSPEGLKIAFRSKHEGEDWLYLMDGDGGNQHRLGSRPAYENPVWSPDGRWIAFVSSEGIYIVSVGGGVELRLYREAYYPHQWWLPSRN